MSLRISSAITRPRAAQASHPTRHTHSRVATASTSTTTTTASSSPAPRVSQPHFLNALPLDLQKSILECLDYRSLCRFGQTERTYSVLSRSNYLWGRLLAHYECRLQQSLEADLKQEWARTMRERTKTDLELFKKDLEKNEQSVRPHFAALQAKKAKLEQQLKEADDAVDREKAPHAKKFEEIDSALSRLRQKYEKLECRLETFKKARQSNTPHYYKIKQEIETVSQKIKNLEKQQFTLKRTINAIRAKYNSSFISRRISLLESQFSQRPQVVALGKSKKELEDAQMTLRCLEEVPGLLQAIFERVKDILFTSNLEMPFLKNAFSSYFTSSAPYLGEVRKLETVNAPFRSLFGCNRVGGKGMPFVYEYYMGQPLVRVVDATTSSRILEVQWNRDEGEGSVDDLVMEENGCALIVTSNGHVRRLNPVTKRMTPVYYNRDWSKNIFKTYHYSLNFHNGDLVVVRASPNCLKVTSLRQKGNESVLITLSERTPFTANNLPYKFNHHVIPVLLPAPNGFLLHLQVWEPDEDFVPIEQEPSTLHLAHEFVMEMDWNYRSARSILEKARENPTSFNWELFYKTPVKTSENAPFETYGDRSKENALISRSLCQLYLPASLEPDSPDKEDFQNRIGMGLIRAYHQHKIGKFCDEPCAFMIPIAPFTPSENLPLPRIVTLRPGVRSQDNNPVRTIIPLMLTQFEETGDIKWLVVSNIVSPDMAYPIDPMDRVIIQEETGFDRTLTTRYFQILDPFKMEQLSAAVGALLDVNSSFEWVYNELETTLSSGIITNIISGDEIRRELTDGKEPLDS